MTSWGDITLDVDPDGWPIIKLNGHEWPGGREDCRKCGVSREASMDGRRCDRLLSQPHPMMSP